ncbi:hypothetical protein LINPERHAP1_LOCUS34469 [Linum perenne]
MASSDHYYYSDSVKAEKADAIRNYNRKKQLLHLGRLIAASALLFWSFKTLPFLTQRVAAYVSVFGQHFFAFLIANAIVLFVYHFSSSANRNQATPAGKDADSSSSSFQSELYEEYVSLSSARRLSTSETDGSEAEILPTAEVFLPETKDVVNSGGAVVPANDSTVVVEAPAGSLEIHEVKAIRYRRTRSVVTAEALTVKLIDEGGNDKSCDRKKELRRSESTVVAKRKQTVVLERSMSFNQARKSIEDMNNDEFNMTVESFIATKKKLLRDENIALSAAAEV